ncbi:MAG: MmgE/PrpD family protein [Alphaproteobacteria bacterium]
MIKALAHISPETDCLSRYMAAAGRRRLPAAVTERAKLHILDTLSAMISGSELLPGRRAIAYVEGLGGRREAAVAGSRIVTSAPNAALANGMLAHADETDDSHVASHTHPGCAVVPAALAAAEKVHAGGRAFLRAVTLGYDVGCRLTRALDVDALTAAYRSTHSFGGTFGAGAAAGCLFALSPAQMRYLLSYCAQLASGCTSNVRDGEHIEKAFDFGGMPAHHGALAATMVAAGFTGVDDVFSGERNFLDAFAPIPHPEELCGDLGKRYEVTETNIKRWTVGSPMQAALDSLEWLMREKGITPREVEAVRIHLAPRASRTVDDAPMPNINAQHLAALMLIDGTLTFTTSHDAARMKDSAVRTLRRRVRIVPNEELATAKPARQAIVEIDSRDGRKFSRRTVTVRGTTGNPMDRADVAAKARGLMEPVIGVRRTTRLIDAVFTLDKLDDVTRLRPLFVPQTRRKATS